MTKMMSTEVPRIRTKQGVSLTEAALVDMEAVPNSNRNRRVTGSCIRRVITSPEVTQFQDSIRQGRFHEAELPLVLAAL